MNVKNKTLAGLVIASILSTGLAQAADLTFSAPVTVSVGGLNLTIVSGSTGTSYIVGSSTLTVSTTAGETLEVISTDRYTLATNSVTSVMVCSDAQSRVTVAGTATVTITPSATPCSTPVVSSSGGGGGGGSSTPTPEKVKETPKVEEKAPAKTKEVVKELTKKLTLTDSKSKASLVLQKGTQLTSGDAAYAGSVSSPGQLNPSKAIIDYGVPSATGTVVQAVQSKTTGDAVVYLSKAGTLTFKITSAQKTKRYMLDAYYYNPTSKSFTKMAGKKTGANFAVSNVTYIGGPFFLVQTDTKVPKVKKSK